VRADGRTRAGRCHLCGGAAFTPWRAVDGRSIVRCAGCGLVFVHPAPGEEEREAQYVEDRTSASDYYAVTEHVDRRTFTARLDVIERRVRPGRVLDVGCNVGTFLLCARARGWTVQGVEPNPQAAKRAQEAGLPVVQGFLAEETLASAGAAFDLVTMWDVIEHVPEPRAALRTVAARLRPGGLLSLSTPAVESPVARMLQVKPLEHLYYFSADTLGRVVREAGLGVESVTRTTRRRDLRHALRGTTLTGWRRRLAALAVGAGLAPVVAGVLARVVRDELWVLARRPEARA
jgi:2-polyprenyl-3-methyl-5-hydroxy-6-metoxy-1,4-benzoquinol methylase